MVNPKNKKKCEGINCCNICLLLFIIFGVFLIGYFAMQTIYRDYDGIRTFLPSKEKVNKNKPVKTPIAPIAPTQNIMVTNPVNEQEITSPLEITGKAMGSWYFEGDFPISLLDADRKVIAEGYLSAQDNWMVDDYVNFSGTLEYKKPATKHGLLILENANPSGLPKNADSFQIPVTFK